ncbi:MAG: TIGR03790 family protein [Desulfobacter sp.]|nr:MAG: TIGR03790 family protein [Desulfobacter sp.]
MKRLICFFICFCLLGLISSAHALEADEVLVLANMNAAASKGLATYYMEKRQIPEENLVLLFVTDNETCSREAYEKKIIPPVRRAVEKNPKIRALVTIYGVPLRIASPGLTLKEQKELDRLILKKSKIDSQLTDNNGSETFKKQLSRVNKMIRNLKKSKDKVASVDSELMLVKKKGYDLNFWLQNPFFLGWNNKKTPIGKSEVLMVSRLDGADAKTVRRIIDDSMEAEKKGVYGTAYFDARWENPGDKKVSGYGLYDRSIHRAADLLSEKKKLDVVIDNKQDLFQKGECPHAALYCGWYSLANYVDAFTWQKGSVGFHIASSECVTLKRDNSRGWCKKMLDKGVAATIGPVGEPYVQSFPVPEIFFDFLVQGHLTLAECYLVSLPYVSWKMVLVGDPLYRFNLKKL